MSIHQFPLKNSCQDEPMIEADPVGQAIAAVVSAAEALFRMVELGKPGRSNALDQMAHLREVKMLSHAATQIQFAASSADIRRIANGQIEAEDAL